MVDGHQVMPRWRDSYDQGPVKVRKPYCLDCGGMPMLSAYIRKGAQGRHYYVIGYWCEFCDGWISELEWLRHHDGRFESYALWSFSQRRAYLWMDKKEFKQKMRKIRLQKLEQLEQSREECSSTAERAFIDRYMRKLRELLRRYE